MIPTRHVAVAVALVFALLAHAGSANGQDRKKITGHDMEVEVDWRWPGCHFGGYFPIRVTMHNDGPARQLVLRFEPAPDNDAPVVDQPVELGRDATVRTTLSVPVVGTGTSGNVLVLQNGTELATLTWGVNLPDPEYGSPRPALLVVNDGVVDLNNFELAVDTVVTRGPSSFNVDHLVLPPEELPDRWIDFTGLDIVSVPLPLLREGRLGPSRRAALLRWVESGGTLFVDRLEGHPASEPGLEDALGLAENAFADNGWQEIAPGQLPEHQRRFGDLRLGWPENGVAPYVRELGYGRVVAFTGDPFVGEINDWGNFLFRLSETPSLAGSTVLAPVWPQRYGISPRQGDDDFQLFLIPGVRNVPVVSFLVLITIFAIVIGPLNYFVLARRRQLNMLIVTIPVLAVLTSFALFAYSTVSQGFSIRSRIRSVTLLDQRRGREFTTARVAMFAGMAPSDGLRYTHTTAVHTIWPEGHEFRGAHVTWAADEQWFDAGWLRPRTRTQFLVQKSADNSARITVTSETPGSLLVRNELGGHVDFLAFRGADGQWYAGRDVDADAAAELRPFTVEDANDYRDVLRRNPLSAPEATAFGGDFDAHERDVWNEWDPDMEFREHGVQSRYTANSAERLLARIGTAVPGDQPARFDYVAVLSESPDVDLGRDGTWPEAGLHVVVGFR